MANITGNADSLLGTDPLFGLLLNKAMWGQASENRLCNGAGADLLDKTEKRYDPNPVVVSD